MNNSLQHERLQWQGVARFVPRWSIRQHGRRSSRIAQHGTRATTKTKTVKKNYAASVTNYLSQPSSTQAYIQRDENKIARSATRYCSFVRLENLYTFKWCREPRGILRRIIEVGQPSYAYIHGKFIFQSTPVVIFRRACYRTLVLCVFVCAHGIDYSQLYKRVLVRFTRPI